MLRRSAAVLFIAVLAVGACGGGGAEPGSPAATAAVPAGGGGHGGGYGVDGTSVPSATLAPPATSAASQPPAAGSPAASPGAAGPTGDVSIVDYAFAPADLAVTAGTTVTWTNADRRVHTVTSADDAFASSATLDSGDTYAITFEDLGTFAYVCAFHPVMQGTITVTP